MVLFHYGVIELGAPGREPSEGPNIDAWIRTRLMQHGMRTPRRGGSIPTVTIEAIVRGNNLLIPWFASERSTGYDELEMPDAWLACTKRAGFIAVYLNFCPTSTSIDELRDMGALMGIVPIAREVRQ